MPTNKDELTLVSTGPHPDHEIFQWIHNNNFLFVDHSHFENKGKKLTITFPDEATLGEVLEQNESFNLETLAQFKARTNTEQVTITNLPCDVDRDHLSNWLAKLIYTRVVLIKIHPPLPIKTPTTRPTATYKIEDVGARQRLLSRNVLLYKDSVLSVSSSNCYEMTDNSTQLVISGLPRHSSESDLFFDLYHLVSRIHIPRSLNGRSFNWAIVTTKANIPNDVAIENIKTTMPALNVGLFGSQCKNPNCGFPIGHSTKCPKNSVKVIFDMKTSKKTKTIKDNTPSNGLKLKITSWNVNGIDHDNSKKFKKIKSYISQNYGIHMLQEVHLPNDVTIDKLQSKNSRLFLNVGTDHSSGVALNIPIPDTQILTYSDSSINKHDFNSRIITCRISWCNNPITLVNIYAPAASIAARCDFFSNLKTKLQDLQGPFIIGGDFNCVLQPEIDLTNYNPKTHSSLKEDQNILQDITIDHNLHDIWRKFHPKDIVGTFGRGQAQINKQSRLDRFYISESLLPLIESCRVEFDDSSDHYPISLTLLSPSEYQVFNHHGASTPTSCLIKTT